MAKKIRKIDILDCSCEKKVGRGLNKKCKCLAFETPSSTKGNPLKVRTISID